MFTNNAPWVCNHSLDMHLYIYIHIKTLPDIQTDPVVKEVIFRLLDHSILLN